jgi:recombination protein RecA
MSEFNELVKKFKKKHTTTMFQKGVKYEPTKRINFSSPRANWMLRGGIPLGRLTEFAGQWSSGKTTLSSDIIANAQSQFQHDAEFLDKEPKKILFVDVENTLDAKWANTLGVDTDEIYMFRPDTQSAEEILQYVEDACHTNEFGLIVFDSIGALVTEARLKKDINEATFCGVAGPYTIFTNNMLKATARTKTAFLGLNHCKPKIGAQFPTLVYGGGETWKYQCSVRLLLSQGSLLDEEGKEVPNKYETPMGHKIEIKLNKTKVCAPDRKLTSFTLNYENGIDIITDTVYVAQILGLIELKGSWYNINGNKFQGIHKLKAHFESETEEFAKIYTQVNEYVMK